MRYSLKIRHWRCLVLGETMAEHGRIYWHTLSGACNRGVVRARDYDVGASARLVILWNWAGSYCALLVIDLFKLSSSLDYWIKLACTIQKWLWGIISSIFYDFLRGKHLLYLHSMKIALHFLPYDIWFCYLWLFLSSELLRENKRMLDRSIREIERERQGLQAQEKKLITEIKKTAKEGQMVWTLITFGS